MNEGEYAEQMNTRHDIEVAMEDEYMERIKNGETRREIKFRAWDKKEKKMLSMDDGEFSENPIWKLNTVEFNDEFIIIQYTGLKDKNGKEIFEGDIVKYSIDDYTISDFFKSDSYIKKEGISYVYRSKYGCYVIDINSSTNVPYHLPFGNYPQTTIEVIGNVYENPELLKGR